MNSTKKLIGVVVLFLVALPAPAQSILENLIFESAVANSILQEQVGSDILMAGALPGCNTPVGSKHAVFMPASNLSNAGQKEQLEFTPEVKKNGSTWTESDDISFANAIAIPELKRLGAAFDLLLPAAQRFPSVWLIPYDLARYCAQTGRLDKCEEWFKKTMAIDGQSVKRVE